MKTLYQTLVLIFWVVSVASAQDNSTQPFLQFDFHKVADDKISDYLKMEKEWRKVNEQLKKEGKISRWMLYEVLLPSGSSVEHNYITVRIYPKFASLETILPDAAAAFAKTHPGQNFGEFYHKTDQTRNRTRTEILQNTDGYWNPKAFFEHKYARIDYMKVSISNTAAYIASENTFWKPAHKVAVEAGKWNGWQLCSRLYATEGDAYTQLTATFYKDFTQVFPQLSDFEMLLKKAHPTMSEKEMGEKLIKSLSLREHKQSHLIKLLDSI